MSCMRVTFALQKVEGVTAQIRSESSICNTLYLRYGYILMEGSKITSHHLFLDVMQSGQNKKLSQAILFLCTSDFLFHWF